MDVELFHCLTTSLPVPIYEGISKIFRTDAVKNQKNKNKRVWKLPTSTQLHATWHTDSHYTVVLTSTGASRYHNCCIDGGTSPEYFGYTIVHVDPASLLPLSYQHSHRITSVSLPNAYITNINLPTDQVPCHSSLTHSNKSVPNAFL
jgi:hypothetical protein